MTKKRTSASTVPFPKPFPPAEQITIKIGRGDYNDIKRLAEPWEPIRSIIHRIVAITKEDPSRLKRHLERMKE